MGKRGASPRVVGAGRFELPTSQSRTERSTKLSHAPPTTGLYHDANEKHKVNGIPVHFRCAVIPTEVKEHAFSATVKRDRRSLDSARNDVFPRK